jgi:hypothetical protein
MGWNSFSFAKSAGTLSEMLLWEKLNPQITRKLIPFAGSVSMVEAVK